MKKTWEDIPDCSHRYQFVPPLQNHGIEAPEIQSF